MNYWLVKSEPETYSWDQFIRDKRSVWDGVRNYAARLNLLAMRKGDLILFYHSNTGKEIVGVATLSKEAYPEPGLTEGNWVCVELKPKKTLTSPVTLAQIKANRSLASLELVRISRLSVSKVSEIEFNEILRLGNTTL